MSRCLAVARWWITTAIQSFVLCAVCSAPAAAQSPTIFVGPNTRGQFVDMDAGIRDSIRDIIRQIELSKLRVASVKGEATLTLIVLGRGRVAQGSVGFASGQLGFGIVVPNEKPTLTTLLKVGNYERVFQSEGGTWTAAANAVVDDLLAWWQANQSVFPANASSENR